MPHFKIKYKSKDRGSGFFFCYNFHFILIHKYRCFGQFSDHLQYDAVFYNEIFEWRTKLTI